MGKELRNTFLYQYFKGDENVDYAALLRAWVRSKFRGTTPLVGWLLCGDERVGSSRIQGFNISRELNRLGVASFIIQRPRVYKDWFALNYYTKKKILASRFDVVVFQRVHHDAGDFVRQLRTAGTRTVFVMADYFPTAMPRLCDRVIVVSETLRQFLIDDGVAPSAIDVVPDALETGESLCKRYDAEPGRPLRVVWVGNKGHWGTLGPVREALGNPGLADLELVTISDHPEASVRWDVRTVWDEILQCDIAVVPADTSTREGLAKSNNRVTMFKALGLPVICSPLPSYRKVIAHGVSGYFADRPEEWADCLLVLRDKSVREAVGLADREAIFQRYALSPVALRYKRTLLNLEPRAAEG